ncbi:MAG TPA: hypothetical protein VHX62_14770 [Solirubrobacteraceae bacterium]|jgi:hypothetical protein|nr:hypothetical protein [Solirubrobacteraceae bacterium]
MSALAETTAPAATRARRRARALTGWLSTTEIQRLDRAAADPARVQAARAVLRTRPPHPDQTGVIGEWPAELAAYADALRASVGAQPMFAEGWRLAMITDLRRVIAAQATVVADTTEGEPGAGLLDGRVPDLEALAQLALPLADSALNIQSRFDEEQQRWIITSANPNLRIVGTFSGEVQPSVMGFGFFFRMLASFVSVAEFRGRYVLRDGYHRSYRLLAAGITAVPAFVRQFGDDELPVKGLLLGPDVYCGPTPPLLGDYFHDDLAADVWLGAAETTAIVSASPQRLAMGSQPRVPALA